MEIPFKTLITLFAAIFIILFGYNAIMKLMNTSADAEVGIFTNTIKTDLEVVAAQRSTIERQYELPNNVGSVIIVDRAFRNVLTEDEILRQYPLVIDSLDTGELRNIFFFTRTGNFLYSDYIGDIEIGSFDGEPCKGYAIIENAFGMITLPLSFTGKLFIGESCPGQRIISFAGPFNQMQDLADYNDIEIASTLQRITLRLDRDVDLGDYVQQGHFLTRNLPIDSSMNPQRLYFRAQIPEGARLQFQMGYNMSDDSGWKFSGPSGDDTYYENYGQVLTVPEGDFNAMRINVTMQRSPERTSPEIYAISIATVPESS